MRVRLLCVLTVVAALFAVPAGAQALTIGISENQPTMFEDPLFKALNVKNTRVVVSYNVMTSGDDELARVSQYLTLAQAAGIEPLVTFEHARGAAELCKNNKRLSQCKLPTVAQYEQNLRLFLSRFPQVKVIAPWNEANHNTQPTARKPATAAKFADILTKNCANCTNIVADVLDQANNPKSKRPKFTSTTRWIKRFKRALKSKRNVCGVHNYSDTNRFRRHGTKALIRALGCKQIWLTETGGIYSFGSGRNAAFRPSESRQLRATKYMFSTARSNRKISRLYVYTWFGGVTPRFDAGLVVNGQPRSSYAEIQKRIQASQARR
jgi:hypothetical protein